MRYPKKRVIYESFDTDFLSGESCPPRAADYSEPRFFRRALSFVLYRLIATPIAFLHSRLVLRQRVIGRERLKGQSGFLLVGNHNEACGDAFSPSVVAFPRKTYVIVHRDNTSKPFLRSVTPSLGAIPVPQGIREARAFSERVGELIARGSAVAVYPEAHLWQKCSFLRPFELGAFDPAVRGGFPVFSMTRVYKRHRLFGYVTRLYIDGPFVADSSLSRSSAAAELAARVGEKMEERLKEGDVCIIEYVTAEKADTNNESEK